MFVPNSHQQLSLYDPFKDLPKYLQKYQYALRLTSEKRPYISKNTFNDFRKRITDYYKKTDINLIQQEVEALADLIREHLEIEGNRARKDWKSILKIPTEMMLSITPKMMRLKANSKSS